MYKTRLGLGLGLAAVVVVVVTVGTRMLNTQSHQQP